MYTILSYLFLLQASISNEVCSKSEEKCHIHTLPVAGINMHGQLEFKFTSCLKEWSRVNEFTILVCFRVGDSSMTY
jgi:hypothetical protein